MYFTSTSLIEFHPTSSHFSLQSGAWGSIGGVVTDLSHLNSSNLKAASHFFAPCPFPHTMAKRVPSMTFIQSNRCIERIIVYYKWRPVLYLFTIALKQDIYGKTSLHLDRSP